MAGHIKLDRKILTWEWYQDANTCRLFIHLLLTANHKDGRWQGKTIGRGQLITGLLKLNEDTGLSIRQLRTSFDKLKMTGEITIKTTNRFRLVTICKYDTYQSIKNSNDNQDDNQIDSQMTSKRQTDDKQATTNNNEKNNKEEKEYNTKPFFSDFNGLPELKINSAIQLMQITQKTAVTSSDVESLWEVFKVENLTGENFYASREKVYTHFIRWVKGQKIEKQKGQPKTTYQQSLEEQRKNYKPIAE